MKDLNPEELDFYKAAEIFALRIGKTNPEAAEFAEKQVVNARRDSSPERPFSDWV